MTYGELTRRLRRLGIEFQHQGKGSHEFWWNPKTGASTRIPVHRGQEIAPGTLRSILRELGLNERDLRNA
jgi:predicted RNA binding protein YcfA (HicA-like mRNA interferase family)